MAKQTASRPRRLLGCFVFAALMLVFQGSSGAQSIPSTLGWYQIPNTKLRSVCAVTQGFSSVAATEGCSAITADWNSGVFDKTNNRLIIWGGGHNGYYGNEVYALDMDTLTMSRLNNPSVPFNLCSNSNPDGTPTSRHTHDQILYIDHLNKMYNKGGSIACQTGGISQGAWSFDFATLRWSSKTTGPNNSGSTYTMDYDPVTRLVYVHGDDLVFRSYRADTDTWTTLRTGAFSGSGGSNYRRTGIIDPVRRKFLMIGNGTVHAYDISNSNYTPEVWNTTGATAIIKTLAPGLAYDPNTREIIAWSGGNTVYRLNPDTKVWSSTSYAGGPSAMSNGTYKRFAYVPRSNVFVTCNSVDENCYTLRLSSGAGAPPPPSSFDFALSNGGSKAVTQGQSVSNTVTLTLVSGTTQTAGFSVSGLPAGATGSFTQSSCAPSCSTTLNISTLSTTPTGNYTIDISSVSGSLTKSTAFTLTVNSTTTAPTAPPPSGSTDFQARCGSPGVIKCVSFDTQSDIAGTYGDNHGTLPGNSTPVLDSSIKASGNSSIKFTIPSNSGANSSGSYFTNFSSDLSTQFGQNSEFYVQWRQRFSPEFLNTIYQGGGGWKQSIIGTGDKPGCSRANAASTDCYSSCSSLETVTQNTNHRGFAQMYNSCSGSASHGPYDPFNQSFGGDFKLQNARPSPYCLYSQRQTSYFPPTGNCFAYFPNEWMTFQVHIKTGPRVNNEFTNSFVQLWIARDGQPSALVLNWGPYNLSAGSTSEDQRYGKVWLLPYNTGKSASQSHPTAYTWYDELIISRNKIADPASSGSGGGGGTVTSAPAAPSALSIQ